MNITEEYAFAVARECARAKDKWLEYWVTPLLPPICIRWVKEKKNLGAVAAYLERKNIRIVRRVGETRETLMRGDEIIATFEFKLTRT